MRHCSWRRTRPPSSPGSTCRSTEVNAPRSAEPRVATEDSDSNVGPASSPSGSAFTTTHEFLAEGGEGLQHVALWSTNYQRDYDRMLHNGFVPGQEGQIGGPDGRFVYFETDGHRGSVLELSDVSGAKGVFFEHIRSAAERWDGNRPVRTVE